MTIAISPPGVYSTSPRRSSPLSAPPLQPGVRPSKHISIPRKPGHVAGHAAGSSPGTRAAAAAEAAHSVAVRAGVHSTPAASGPSPSPPSPLTTTSASPAAAVASSSPGSPASPAPSLSRSQPLAGSYPLSLLHARMAAHTPHSAGEEFAVRVRAVATASAGSAPRAPAPLVVPFTATYYDLALSDTPAPPGAGANHSPWVGDVDLESHFFATYAADGAAAPASSTASQEPPAYPGYRVPPVGQLQLLIKTTAAAVHAFIVPYDVSALVEGARLLVRERTYVRSETAADDDGRERESTPATPTSTTPTSPSTPATRRESLRYAVQLQFACVADPSSTGERAFYLARTLKLVFTSAPPEQGLGLRTERADEVVPPPSRRALRGAQAHAHRRSISSSPLAAASFGSSPGSASPPRVQPRRSSFEASAEWAHVRAAWRARAASAAAVARGFDPPAERPSSPALVAPSPRSLLSALAPEDRALSPSPRRATPLSTSASASASTATATHDSDAASTGSAVSAAASISGSGSASLSSSSHASARRPGMSRAPSVADTGRRRLSREERELSARLAAMDMDA